MNLQIIDLHNNIPQTVKDGATKAIKYQILFHQTHFSFGPQINIPIRLFTNIEEYKSYQVKISKTAKSKNGFYSISKNEIVVSQNKKTFKTILHEAQHAIFRSKMKKAPKWVNEGLSECFETAHVEFEVSIKIQSQKKRRLIKLAQERNSLNLPHFLGLSNSDWTK
ncbi:MAG: hypothetical protein AAF490_31775, partial [Chloroflexota bacterium]